jgi:hypothetical protein
MSSPKNRLENKNTYPCYFVIQAFSKTDIAEKGAEKMSLEDGPEGEPLNGGVVIVNDSIQKDKAPTRFFVKDFNYEYIWSGNHVNTTISGGSLIIHDTSGGEFLTFIKEKVIEVLATSIENITFVAKCYWTNEFDKFDSPTPEIVSEPLFFSIAQIEHKITGNQHFYDCDVIPLYNTKAQYTSYNRIYGMSITHESGNLHDEIPEPNPSGGSIKPRGAEDGEKKDPRKNRINKSKPMTTLGDVFAALEKELNESTKIHQAQLQEWQKVIRDDFVDKLKKPTQEKDLNIKYKINLDPDYSDYSIDNRNLPFEQPEQKQSEAGIRVVPSVYGETIDDLIDRIMALSKTIGQEAGELPAKDYKVCKVWRRQGDNVLYDIVIKKYKVPYNPATGVNTGKGEGAVNPFTFYYKVKGEDFDVMMFDGILHRVDGLKVVEDVDDTDRARLSFGAEREPITVEREVNTPYFKTGYSGNRAKIANQKVLGTEYPREHAQLIKKKFPLQNIQQSAINITIPGNPDLMSDLMRKPSDTASGNHDAIHYKRPEVLPMYAKIIIRHEPLQEGDSLDNPAFYHEEWMHIYKIQNIITNGTFFQRLTLLRTDDMV